MHTKNNDSQRCDHLDSFYDRQDEIELLESLLSKENSLLSESIINFHGITGSGKTWLLEWVWCKYESNFPCLLFPNSITYPHEMLLSKQRAIWFVINSLQEQLATQFEIPAELLARTNHSLDELESKLNQLFRFIDDQQLRLLILVDDYDTIPSQLKDIIANVLLTRVVRSDNVLALLTSNSSYLFEESNPTLGLNTLHVELETFTQDAIERQHKIYSELSSCILNVTAGLPICVENLIDYLPKHNITTESQFLRHESKVVQYNYHTYVEKHILANTDSVKLQAMIFLSVPRRFNIGIMSSLLPKWIPSNYQGFTNVDYLGLVQDFKPYAQWNPSRNGYSIQGALRQILQHYYKTKNPENFNTVNSELIEMYESQNLTSMSIHSIIELLYHKLLSLQLSSDEVTTPSREVRRKFSEEVGVFYEQYKRDTTLDELNAFYESVINDKDLRDYLTRNVCNVMKSELMRRELKQSVVVEM
jgi:hypothetical protein